MATRALSLRVKRPGCETDHSPPSSDEVKNEWSYTSTPQYASMASCLVKHRDDFIIVLDVKLLYQKLSKVVGLEVNAEKVECVVVIS
jgi:hypothetical protein